MDPHCAIICLLFFIIFLELYHMYKEKIIGWDERPPYQYSTPNDLHYPRYPTIGQNNA